MKYGLSESNISKIINCIAVSDNVEEAHLFGSRAKDNFKEGSDIDICIKGENLTLQDIFKIQNKYDDTYLLYKLDLVIYHKIAEPTLIIHIDRVGINLFQKIKNKKIA